MATCWVMPRGAFRPLAGVGDVGDHRAHDADEVDARMGEEALVLGGDESLQDALGHGGHRHEHALLARIFRQQPAVGGIQARGDRRLVVGELLVVGQAMAEVPEQACHCASANDQSGRCKGQQDFEQVQHFHFLYAAALGAATPSMEGSYAFLVAANSGPEMGIDRGPQRPCQGNLVLAHRQKLLVLGIGQIAELDQGGGDIGRGQHGKARLAMGPGQQPHAVAAEGLHDGIGEPAGIVHGAALAHGHQGAGDVVRLVGQPHARNHRIGAVFARAKCRCLAVARLLRERIDRGAAARRGWDGNRHAATGTDRPWPPGRAPPARAAATKLSDGRVSSTR